MSYYLKVALKLIASVVASAIAFAVGFVIVGSWYDRTVLPAMYKNHPYDGQIGLESFVAAVKGGFTFAVIAFVLAIFFTYKTSKRTTSILQRK